MSNCIGWDYTGPTRLYAISPPKDHQMVLWEGIVKGDHQALNTLMRSYTSRYYPFVYRWVGRQQRAEDILQEAFLKLWTKPEAYNPSKGRFETWFYRVLSNLCIDFFRKSKNQVTVAQDYLEDLCTQEATQLDNSISVDEKKILLKQISTLAAKEQAVLHLFYFEEFSTQETAAIVGKSIRGTESLLYRAKKNLEQVIKGGKYG